MVYGIHITHEGHAPKGQKDMHRYYTKPAEMDPDFSVSVMDSGSINAFGETRCIAAAVTPRQGNSICRKLNTGRTTEQDTITFGLRFPTA